MAGGQHVTTEVLTARDKGLLQPLHVKMGMMKQSVKALSNDGSCIEYIAHTLLGITINKFKA